MYINNHGRMTKMAAMPIYGKRPSNIISITGRPKQTWHVALCTRVPQGVHTLLHCNDLKLFYGKVC